MSKVTKVVNLRTDKYDVYIGRPGKGEIGLFGNPYPLAKESERGSILEKYKKFFLARLEHDDEFKTEVLKLNGKTLGCFCKPRPCHGDIICEYLNGLNNVDE